MLAAAGVPSAPVNDVVAAVEEARLVEYEHPQLGTVRQVASPLRLSGDANRPCARRRRAASTRKQVLVELCGYSAERVRELADAGVFGDLTKGATNAETGVSA